MEAELAPLEYDFDRVAAQTRTKWNKLLGKIEIEGQNEVDKTKFYTNLYRAYAGKQTWNDVNGQYRDACENVQQLDHGNMYGGDAFWNSFWNRPPRPKKESAFFFFCAPTEPVYTLQEAQRPSAEVAVITA